MSLTIDVVFDGEVLRPEQPLKLRRDHHYSIVINDVPDTLEAALPDKDATNMVDEAWLIYDSRLKSILEPSHIGQVVAIDTPSGDYEVAANSPAARKALRQRHPAGTFVVIDIGVLPVDNPLTLRATSLLRKQQ